MGNGLHGLASGMKRVDTAAYMAVQAVAEGTFTAGVTSLGLAEGGVGISKLRDLIEFVDFGIGAGAITLLDVPAIVYNWARNRLTVPGWIWDAVDELEAGILDGSIVVPTADTGAEMAAVRAEYTLGAP
jgi:basic membrane protein A